MPKQFRAMFDTNVYAVLYKSHLGKISGLVQAGSLVVYGCTVIRKELREILKGIMVGGKNYRSALLKVYDELVEKHDVPVAGLSEELARQYLKEYAGGSQRRKIYPDFLIVATAAIHALDLVVSGDEKTMKSGPARAAYEKVNKRNGLKTPNFVKLEEL